jgi:hypothetical protein
MSTTENNQIGHFREREAIQAALTDLIQRQKQVTFIDPESEFSTDERALATMVAQFAHWDFNRLVEVAVEMFTDANFSEMANDIEKLANA